MAEGTIVGDILNAGVSAWNAYEEREAEEKARREKRAAVEKAAREAGATYDQIAQILRDYDQGRIRLTTEASETEDPLVRQYKELISTYKPQTYDFGEFAPTYTKTVEDFLNPEAEKIANLAGLETQAQLAGQGAAKGTGALAGMGYSRWKAAEDLYKDAQEQLRLDRSQAYTEYGDYIDRMQKKLDTLNKGQLDRASLLGGAVQSEQTAQSDYISDLVGMMQDKASTNINATIGAF